MSLRNPHGRVELRRDVEKGLAARVVFVCAAARFFLRARMRRDRIQIHLLFSDSLGSLASSVFCAVVKSALGGILLSQVLFAA